MGRHRGGIYITKPVDPARFKKYTCCCGCGVEFYDYSNYYDYTDRSIFLNRAHSHRWLQNDKKAILLTVKERKKLDMAAGSTRLLKEDYASVLQFWAVYLFASWFDKYVKFKPRQRAFFIKPDKAGRYVKKMTKTKYTQKFCVCCGEIFFLRSSDARCLTEDFCITMNIDHKARYMTNDLKTTPLDDIERESLNMNVLRGFWQFHKSIFMEDENIGEENNENTNSNSISASSN